MWSKRFPLGWESSAVTYHAVALCRYIRKAYQCGYCMLFGCHMRAMNACDDRLISEHHKPAVVSDSLPSLIFYQLPVHTRSISHPPPSPCCDVRSLVSIHVSSLCFLRYHAPIPSLMMGRNFATV